MWRVLVSTGMATSGPWQKPRPPPGASGYGADLACPIRRHSNLIWANDTLAGSQAQPLQAMATFAANNSDFSPATAKQMPNDLTLQTAAAGNWRHA
jgi:hypothetical protein